MTALANQSPPAHVLEKRPLGRTGFECSSLALGTVSLGMDYGIESPDGFGKPSDKEAIETILHAVELGIRVFDTAPAYGDAERLLGLALADRHDCLVATKVQGASGATIRASLTQSHERLRRETLDIVQIHNATAQDLDPEGPLLATLIEAKAEGAIRVLGASVYGEEAALAAIRCGHIQVLQIAFNILDQRMKDRVFPAAASAGVGILARSIFLRGALTEKGIFLGPALAAVQEAVDAARSRLGTTWSDLAATALRFGLSEPAISSVLVGARTVQEIKEAVRMASLGSLPAVELDRARSLSLSDDALLNPTRWP